jgi:hypothetical protein
MKTKNVVRRIFTMVMVMALMLTTSMTALAATGSRTYKSSSKMTIVLNPGQRGNSNTVTIRVSDLPEDAIITKLTVNTGSMSYSGAVVCNYLTISSSNGRTEQIGWTGQANKTLTTSKFLASAANGTYTISFNATNMSSLDIGTKSYQPSITIYWDDEF